MAFYFTLFCVLAFSLVPVLLDTFLALQVRIGNGGHALVTWLRIHERSVVCSVWGIFCIGLLIAFSLARDEIVNLLE